MKSPSGHLDGKSSGSPGESRAQDTFKRNVAVSGLNDIRKKEVSFLDSMYRLGQLRISLCVAVASGKRDARHTDFRTMLQEVGTRTHDPIAEHDYSGVNG